MPFYEKIYNTIQAKRGKGYRNEEQSGNGSPCNGNNVSAVAVLALMNKPTQVSKGKLWEFHVNLGLLLNSRLLVGTDRKKEKNWKNKLCFLGPGKPFF